MALEQKLHLKLSQKLIMTPSLQQAIKLLQLSKLELQEVLNQELLENPLLEESAEEHEEFPIENTLTRPPNLTDHLTWQLSMSDASPRIKEIGAFIIGNIDEDGYLRATNEEIAAAGGYDPAEVVRAVEAVQSLDPI